MKKTPRPYQVDGVVNTAKSLFTHKATILHVPTGGGKSIMIDMIVTRANDKNNTVLVLSDARKIYRQLVKECDGIEINSDVKEILIQNGKCYVGMIQTLLKRPMILAQLQALKQKLILVIDECHVATSTKLIDYLPDALRVGCTATPYGYLHKHLPIYYNDFVEGPQVDWLIQNGYLTPYRHIIRSAADVDLLEIRNGEYTEKSQEKVFGAQKVYDGLFEDLKTMPYKKALIFVASIKQADSLCQKLIDKGFKAVRYHSKVENGEFELAKFTELDLADILVTIKSLSKGWDYPPIDWIGGMHKTMSTSVYQQELGRGARLFPGKDIFTYVDYANNWEQHGLYFEDRPYSELWNKIKRRGGLKEGATSSKACLNCLSLIPISARICKYCDYEYPEQEQVLAQGELIDITEAYHNMVGRKISELDPKELADYAKLKNKKQFAIRVAKAKEQQEAGFIKQFASNMGYRPSWIDHQHIPTETILFTDIILR